MPRGRFYAKTLERVRVLDEMYPKGATVQAMADALGMRREDVTSFLHNHRDRYPIRNPTKRRRWTAPALRLIFKLKAEGKTYNDIANALAEAGYDVVEKDAIYNAVSRYRHMFESGEKT